MRVLRDQGPIIRLAHRGASGQAPENTHAAFAKALQLGVDGIELDCQLSADGELVVIHDEILDRTTSGLGPVCAKTWAELAKLDAGAWRGPEFRGERIPRLLDVLAQIDGRATLNVEIKSARDVGSIEPKLAALPEIRAAADWLLFSSFNADAVRNLRAAAPWASIGILWDRRPAAGAFLLAEELGARCVIPSRRVVDGELVTTAHDRGLGVWVWTVNTREDLERITAVGADAIFSDYPERFAPSGR